MFFKIDILGTLSSLNYILGYNFVNFVCYLGHGIGEDHAWHVPYIVLERYTRFNIWGKNKNI